MVYMVFTSGGRQSVIMVSTFISFLNSKCWKERQVHANHWVTDVNRISLIQTIYFIYFSISDISELIASDLN